MQTADKFINWLEGYLDASKNKLEPNQVREIRKRILVYHKEPKAAVTPLWDSTDHSISNNSRLNEDFIQAIERNKNASTMEDIAAD